MFESLAHVLVGSFQSQQPTNSCAGVDLLPGWANLLTDQLRIMTGSTQCCSVTVYATRVLVSEKADARHKCQGQQLQRSWQAIEDGKGSGERSDLPSLVESHVNASSSMGMSVSGLNGMKQRAAWTTRR